jgi:hypothetical protein
MYTMQTHRFGCIRHRLRSTLRFASHSENESAWNISAISSAYWNCFDNVDGTSDKYKFMRHFSGEVHC